MHWNIVLVDLIAFEMHEKIMDEHLFVPAKDINHIATKTSTKTRTEHS